MLRCLLFARALLVLLSFLVWSECLWFDIGVVALVVFRFIGCAILFFALVVGISLAVVGLSDSTHDDFRDVMSLIAITVTLCLVAAALLIFLSTCD